MEIINIQHILFLVNYSGRKLNWQKVQQHFQRCLKLLSYSTFQDAHSITKYYQEQLKYFQNYEFPLEDIINAHSSFEVYRQFYSGMVKIEVNTLVMKTYQRGELPAPRDMDSKVDAEILNLVRKRDALFQQENYN